MDGETRDTGPSRRFGARAFLCGWERHAGRGARNAHKVRRRVVEQPERAPCLARVVHASAQQQRPAALLLHAVRLLRQLHGAAAQLRLHGQRGLLLQPRHVSDVGALRVHLVAEDSEGGRDGGRGEPPAVEDHLRVDVAGVAALGQHHGVFAGRERAVTATGGQRGQTRRRGEGRPSAVQATASKGTRRTRARPRPARHTL